MARFRYQRKDGEFGVALASFEVPIALAGTEAIAEAADIVKREGRQDIASAGFSKRWQNALRVNLYPKRGVSMSAAAVIYHKIRYAGVFEEGATISGQPLLWLPLPDAPKGRGGARLRPSEYRARIGHPLYSIKRPGKPPLLGANIRVTKARAQKGISLSQLKRGRNPGGKGEVRLVPLYVGVPRVNIRDRFSIRQITERAAAKLGDLYLKHLNPNG
ncbi:hypothetical protein EN829_015055 [Mesorhizobium sp. M00.F.Ca.ET.186.01.1.1]|nr:hypothetical protein EN848_14380 [bacterium M00.F.Ca.ET.205.01.1.1]TGU52999.1 hypothetical protein EN795_15015 [bacterium M00.F.Ca.ET.152.01.1.1]TGV35968.1 hypothetical protein EN829_015055 [Mesorhizobium sp. M00.F.Ca.ET.186.01.1.1]TGZ43551.1 hypothetical protein EN805_10625 [bacterium M00.F.Ca.ET.162.01.1.1]